MTAASQPSQMLEWRDGEWRGGGWHLAGRPVHSGAHLLLACGGGHWVGVRISLADAGRLFAHVSIHGREFSCRLSPDDDRLKWPD